MNSNNDCSCDANKFYEKYKDRIEVILSQRFTDDDNTKTLSDDSLEEEYYEKSKTILTPPRGILASKFSKSQRKSVSFTETASLLEKVSDEDIIKPVEEYDRKNLKKDENVEANKIIQTDKEIVPSHRSSASILSLERKVIKKDGSFIPPVSSLKLLDHDKKRMRNDGSLNLSISFHKLSEHDGKEMKKDGSFHLSAPSHKLSKHDGIAMKKDESLNLPISPLKLLELDEKEMKKDQSFIPSVSSLKLSDHDGIALKKVGSFNDSSLKLSNDALRKYNSKQSLVSLETHKTPVIKHSEMDAKLEYLTKQRDMAEEGWQGKGDMYYHEQILQQAKERIAKYDLYETSSLGEGDDKYSIKYKPKTEEWYSESQRRAEMYLKSHRILELFHFLGAHLTVSNTENPIDFLINLLDSCLKYRDGNDEPPLFFTSKYIKSLFGTMDRMNTGVISLKQYRNGMLTLGIKEYEKYPKTDENYMVDETTFVEEALISLKAQLNGIIKAVPTPSVTLLWPSEITSRTSVMSA